MLLRRLLRMALVAATILVVFIVGVVFGGHPQSTGLNQLPDPVRSWVLGDSGTDLSSQVLDLLRNEYYREIDEEALERASVDALLEELDDPYTAYLDEEELAALRERNEGAYVGIGLQVAGRDEGLVVTRVYDGGPADRAGIRAGDLLVSVEGRPARPGDLESVLGKIRGPEGTEVTLSVRTPGERPRELTMTRERIRVPAVESRVLRDGKRTVGYLHLMRFTRGAADSLAQSTQDLLDQGVDGLVLDLRQDPGGLVSEALGVAGVFLPDGTEVAVTEGHNSPRQVLRTSGDATAGEQVPMVVLVDRNSASSSEIVAGALRDAERAVVVGEPTFGKALVQSTLLLRSGGGLRLTTARYLTPSGFDLTERGLPPDVRAVDDPDTPADEALQRALAQLRADAEPGSGNAPAPAAARPEPVPVP